MEGVFIKFKKFNNPARDDSIFIKASSHNEFKFKLENYFKKYFEKKDETLNYFNFMNIDSDFASNHDCDAYISIHVELGSPDDIYCYEIAVDFEFIGVIL